MNATVIVESPSKCKTISKHLGKGYTVLASYGHVKSLVRKSGSVDPENNFQTTSQVIAKAKVIDDIVKSVKQSDTVYLATDPDREGEAISKDVFDVLQKKKAISKNAVVKRIVFNQITKNALQDAIKNPRDISYNLVDAQEARSSLDYLVGFNLSPILWQKLPQCKSAGRVQSVALRIIAEREDEIDAFIQKEYWQFSADFGIVGETVKFELAEYAGEKVDKNITTEEEAKKVVAALASLSYSVSNVIVKETKRRPYAPFTTSTLQQDASSRISFSPKKTMTVAQKLYEAGHITYMRTDSPAISGEGIKQIRDFIPVKYGKEYLSPKTNIYSSKQKNAQEAHEAIRPTNLSLDSSKLSPDEKKLYELIFKRAVASQCSDARFESAKIDLSDAKSTGVFRTNGSIMIFDGFLKVYNYHDAKDVIIPKVKQGEDAKIGEIEPKQKFTQPPSRYTEAGLVKKLEELGIGRPSTYASTISTLQDRKYADLTNKALIPSQAGRILVSFLKKFFLQYFEYGFTAEMEEKLDKVSSGEFSKLEVLGNFWNPFHGIVTEVAAKSNNDIVAAIEPEVKRFVKDADSVQSCPKCESPLLTKVGRFGPFLACSGYPECKFIVTEQSQEKEADTVITQNEKGEDIVLKKGPYGYYLELKVPIVTPEPEEPKKPKISKTTGKEIKPKVKKAPKPKRVGLPKGVNPEDVTPDYARKMIQLPLVLGQHEDGDVSVGLGKYGPFVLFNKKFYKAPANFLELTLEDAINVIKTSKK